MFKMFDVLLHRKKAEMKGQMTEITTPARKIIQVRFLSLPFYLPFISHPLLPLPPEFPLGKFLPLFSGLTLTRVSQGDFINQTFQGWKELKFNSDLIDNQNLFYDLSVQKIVTITINCKICPWNWNIVTTEKVGELWYFHDWICFI